MKFYTNLISVISVGFALQSLGATPSRPLKSSCPITPETPQPQNVMSQGLPLFMPNGPLHSPSSPTPKPTPTTGYEPGAPLHTKRLPQVWLECHGLDCSWLRLDRRGGHPRKLEGCQGKPLNSTPKSLTIRPTASLLYPLRCALPSILKPHTRLFASRGPSALSD